MAAAAGGVPFISGDMVRSLVSMAEVIEVVERGLAVFSSGGVVQPVRTVVPVTEHHGFLGLMPSYCYSMDVLATKMVTFYPNNSSKGVVSHQAMVFLLEASTGTPLALIDGEVVTAMRTAAASAVALKYMQATPTPPRVLCIIGTGVQARSHAEALSVIHDFKEIRVWGRDPVKASRCASDIGGDHVIVCEDIEMACRDADVIVTVTMATSPVVMGKWLKDNAIVIGVGACRHDWRELDSDLVNEGLIIVDSRDAAIKESGDIILAKAEVYCEVGELVGKGPVTMETARTNGKRLLLFKSLGIGIEDGVTGKLIHEKYKSQQQKLT